MQVLSASATAGLTLKARAETTEFAAGAGKLKTAVATVGGSSVTSYAAATVGYSSQIESTGASDGVTLNLETGVFTTDAGTPTITGDGVDFSGADLPSDMTKVYAIRLSATAENGDIVTATVHLGAQDRTIVLEPGEEHLVKFGTAGFTCESGEIGIVFAELGDILTLEVIAS